MDGGIGEGRAFSAARCCCALDEAEEVFDVDWGIDLVVDEATLLVELCG